MVTGVAVSKEITRREKKERKMTIITFSENIKVIKQCAVRIEEMHPGYPSSPDRVRFAKIRKRPIRLTSARLSPRFC